MPLLTQARLEQYNKQFVSLYAKILASDNPPFNLPDSNGWRLLHLATVINDIERVTDLLISGKVSAQQTMPRGNIKAITLALLFGHLEIAQLLLDHGASLIDCNIKELDLAPARVFYELKWCDNLQVMLESADKVNLFGDIGNGKTYVEIAAEVGCLKIIHYYINTKGDTYLRSPSNSNYLLHIAAENNQVALVDYLLDSSYAIDEQDQYGLTALHRAIQANHMAMVEKLIHANANINIQDGNGKTPLYCAIESGKQAITDLLLHYHADPTVKTYYDESIFHALAKTTVKLPAWVNELEVLKYETNLYGQSPSDYVNGLPQKINQMLFNKKARQYLISQNGDRGLDFVSTGNCNGLSFLFHYYDSHKSLDKFVGKLCETITWDEDLEGLDQPPSSPINDDYASKKAFLEATIAQVLFFQMAKGNIFRMKQRSRKKQLAIFDKPIHPLFIEIDFHLSKEQLAELLSIFSKLPSNTRFEMGGMGHDVALTVRNRLFYYYDCNLDYLIAKHLNVNELTKLIINTKYKRLKPAIADGYDCTFMAYSFPWDGVQSQFNYFQDDELPKNHEEAQAYVSASANGLSHLHIAILTHSKENIERLLKDGFCDINLPIASSTSKLKPIDLAYITKNSEIYKLMLQQPKLDGINGKGIIKLFTQGDSDIIDIVLNQAYANKENSKPIHQSYSARSLLYDDSSSMLLTLFENIQMGKVSKADGLQLFVTLADRLQDKINIDDGFAMLKILYPHMLSIKPHIINVINAIYDININIGCLVKNPCTLLSFFARKKQFAIMQILLDCNADPNCFDPVSKKTPLHMVLAEHCTMQTQEQERTQTIISLMAHGADINLADAQGITCRELMQADPILQTMLAHCLPSINHP
jgi:ankyrin repeat protein